MKSRGSAETDQAWTYHCGAGYKADVFPPPPTMLAFGRAVEGFVQLFRTPLFAARRATPYAMPGPTHPLRAAHLPATGAICV